MGNGTILTLLAALLLLGCEAPTVPPPTTVSPVPAAASSAEGVFRAAIASRAAVGFTYAGVARVALPHRLGASAAGNGKTLVRCWEVTRGGAPTGQWKLYDAAKIRDPRLLPGAPFAPSTKPYPPYQPKALRAPIPNLYAAGK